MKVENNNSSVQLNAYLKQIRTQQQSADPQKTESTRQIGESDKVRLSDRAREVQQAAQTLKAMPEVRTDKVEKVRMEVDQGTYKVVGAQVATDMLRETFENEMILQKINTRV